MLLLCLLFPLSSAPAHESVDANVARLTRQLQEAPRDAELFLKRASFLRLGGNVERAWMDLDRAQRLDEDLIEVELERARLHRDAWKAEQALTHVGRFLDEAPTDSRGWRLLAELSCAPGDVLDAIDCAIHFAEPQRIDDHAERARIALEVAGADAALAYLDDSSRQLGTLPALELLAVDIERDRGRIDQALLRLDRLASTSSRREHWLRRRGDVLSAAGRSTEALVAYREARDALASLTARRRNTPAMLDLALLLDQRIERLLLPHVTPR